MWSFYTVKNVYIIIYNVHPEILVYDNSVIINRSALDFMCVVAGSFLCYTGIMPYAFQPLLYLNYASIINTGLFCSL